MEEKPKENPEMPKEPSSADQTVGETTDQTADKATDQATEKSADQTADETTEKTADQTTEKCADQTADKTTDQTIEKTADKTAGETTEKCADQTADKTTDQTIEKTADKTAGETTEKTTDQTTEIPADQTTEKSANQTADKATDQTTEKSTDQTADETTEKTADQTTEKCADQTADKTTDPTTAKTADKTAGETTEKTTDQTTEKPADQTADENTEKPADQTADETTEKTVVEPADETTEKPSAQHTIAQIIVNMMKYSEDEPIREVYPTSLSAALALEEASLSSTEEKDDYKTSDEDQPEAKDNAERSVEPRKTKDFEVEESLSSTAKLMRSSPTGSSNTTELETLDEIESLSSPTVENPRTIEEAEKSTRLEPATRRVPINRELGQVNPSRTRRAWYSVLGCLVRTCCPWDWIPKMCSCIEAVSTNSRYQRLGSAPTLFQYTATMNSFQDSSLEPLDSERQAELTFYFDDDTFKKLTVERNLRMIDLCELLRVNKNGSGHSWSIVEKWPELGIERTIEDHEDILAVYREMEEFASHHSRKFYFLEDFDKYDVYRNPMQVFVRDIMAFPHDEDRRLAYPEATVKRYLLGREENECPEVCSVVWIRHEGSNSWKKLHMLLKDRKLYTTRKGSFNNSKFPKPARAMVVVHARTHLPDPEPSTSSDPSAPPVNPGRFYYRTSSGSTPRKTPDFEQPRTLAHLSDYYIYKIPNAKKYFNAPYEWAVCLRPASDAEAEETEAGVRGIKVLAFNGEKTRNCWLTAMRLAKYGKQLRENYKAFKNKQCEQRVGTSGDFYTIYNVSSESVRSRVAMDFTGSVGRIVDDPQEARNIETNEGIIWRKTWRPFSRPNPGSSIPLALHGLDRGIHVLQPWFHNNLDRECAAAVIKEHATRDGVFLVRESRSDPGAFVLTFKYNDRVYHSQIHAMYDERGDSCLFTLDGGMTKFYDLLQMVEFHQLNAGSLPTKLTHYVRVGSMAHLPMTGDIGSSSSGTRGSKSPTSPKILKSLKSPKRPKSPKNPSNM